MLKGAWYVTEKELVNQAAKHLSVELDPTDGKDERRASYDAATRKLGSFFLTPDFILFLEKNGFEMGMGKDALRAKMFYVTDRACGNTTIGGAYYSHNWAWNTEEKPEKGKYCLEPHVTLSINQRERGIEILPDVDGNNSGGPAWPETHRRMAWAIASYFPDAGPILKLFAEKKTGPVVLSFSEFGCAGIRSVGVLFSEYFNGNDMIHELARSSLSPFAPEPYIDRRDEGAGSMLFIPEQFHSALYAQWKEQIEDHRAKLAV